MGLFPRETSLFLAILVFLAGCWYWYAEEKKEIKAAKEALQEELRLIEEGKLIKLNLGGGERLSMLWVDPGEFIMGSPLNEDGRNDDEMQHKVTLSVGYWLGKTEVTNGQWQAVMGLTGEDQIRKSLQDDALYLLGGIKQTFRDYWNLEKGSDLKYMVTNSDPMAPITHVSWHDVRGFCERVTAQEQQLGRLPEGYKYGVPTEAQWEYACRAGSTLATSNGIMKILGENNAPVLDSIGWYGGNSSEGFKGKGWSTYNWKEKQYPGAGNANTRKVGLKAANAFGFYDMHGNVNEWCSDWYGPYPESETTDPQGPSLGLKHVYRSGSWNSNARYCRSAKRNGREPDNRKDYLGFRLALVLK